MKSIKYEAFVENIESQTGMSWDSIQADIHEYPTEELIKILALLEKDVDIRFASEIAGRSDAVFHLRKLIQDGQYCSEDSPGKGWFSTHTIHILSLIKSKDALELLLDIIRYRSEELSDWLTENVPSLLYAFGEEAIVPLKEFIKDENLESHVRGTAITALVMLSRNNRSHKKGVMEQLVGLLNTTTDITFASIIANDLVLYHDMSVVPDIYRALEENKIMEFFISKKNVELLIKRKDKDSDIKRNTRDPIDYFCKENIENPDNQSSKSRGKEFTYLGSDDSKSEKPGRNDPCPCGSGKKFKKCCMGKGKS